MQQGCFTDNVSLFNQPDITDEQFFEVDSNLGHMLYFTPSWSPEHFTKWTNIVPLHTEQLFQKHHQEPNKVKIEGWEVRHVELRKLSENNLCQGKASDNASKLDYTWTDSFLNNQGREVWKYYKQKRWWKTKRDHLKTQPWLWKRLKQHYFSF